MRRSILRVPAFVPGLAVALLALASAACGGSRGSTIAADAPASGAPPAAPASATCATLAPPAATATTRAALFAALTANEWTTSYCGNGSCPSLTLDAAGHYTFRAGASPYGTAQDRNDSGSWSLAAIDDVDGLLCLDGNVASPSHPGGAANLPSVLRFKLATYQAGYPSPRSTTSLEMGGSSFAPGQVLSPSLGASADALPDVKVAPAFAALAGVTWTRANPFDSATEPSSIIIDQSGGYRAIYDGTGCAGSGDFSTDRDLLFGGSQQSVCDRGISRIPTGIVPGFFDDLVVLGTTAYRRADAAAGKPSAFVFDPYGHSVRVYGSFDGTLTAGVATTITLTFENTDVALTRSLGTFTVSLQPATVTRGFPQTAGALVPVGSVDLSTVTLDPGKKASSSVVITPPAAGATFALAMRLTFSDATKKYDGGHTFIAQIH